MQVRMNEQTPIQWVSTASDSHEPTTGELPTLGTFISVAQVSTILGVHPDTVRTLLRNGRLRGKKPYGNKRGWYIAVKDLTDYMTNEGLNG